jgi:hypothetical protein
VLVKRDVKNRLVFLITYMSLYLAIEVVFVGDLERHENLPIQLPTFELYIN